MEALFFKAVDMSLTASYIIAAVIILRIILKKAPKQIHCLLWAIVAVRLIFPFSLESNFSLIPKSDTIGEIIIDYDPSFIGGSTDNIGDFSEPVISYDPIVSPERPADIMKVLPSVLTIVWLTGTAVMLIYSCVSYIILKRRVRQAVKTEDGIKQSERVDSPFILGTLKPTIYLPFNISSEDMKNVVAHERSHIARGDHLWKPLGFLLLSIYWFNPLIWVSYILLCRDIESACDERVIKHMSEDELRSYSNTLLNCGTHRTSVTLCPVAFGEIGVRSRIKNVMNYKRPVFWVILLSVVICIILSVCFLTDPKRSNEESGDSEVIKWIDFISSSDEMKWDETLKLSLPSYPDAEFIYTPKKITMKTESGETVCITGMPVYNVYFTDLNFDGYEEMCATYAFGSGMIDMRILVYDIKNEASYSLQNRGISDYLLSLREGILTVSRYKYPYRGSNDKDNELQSRAPLRLKKHGNGYVIDGFEGNTPTFSFYYQTPLNLSEPIKEYAENIVSHHVSSSAGTITQARICDIERIETDTSSHKEKVFLFKLKYELYSDVSDPDILAGGLLQKDGWFTFDDTYFVLISTTGKVPAWYRAGTVSQEAIDTVYSANIMTRQYGNKYNAAAMCTAEKILNALELGEVTDSFNKTDMYLPNETYERAVFVAEKAGIELDPENYRITEDHEKGILSIFFYEKDGGEGIVRVDFDSSEGKYFSTHEMVHFERVDDIKNQSIDYIINELSSRYPADADKLIKENENLYNAAVALAPYNLKYIFAEFSKGDETGLKGEIMKRIMLDVIKESEKIKYHSENGQDYFDNWLKNARSIVNENGIENIRSEYPNIALAVEICGAE